MRLDELVKIGKNTEVSIHARVERATAFLFDSYLTALVSIHARVERATSLFRFFTIGTRVSIHARVERATQLGFPYAPLVPVSIHARVERATRQRRQTSFRSSCFNPRTRRACDVSIRQDVVDADCFNPRTRRACDVPHFSIMSTPAVSIHARVERATSGT